MAGNPTWSANTPTSPGKVIIDSSGNVQQASMPAIGSTGAIPPDWGNVVGAVTADAAVIWTCVAVLETIDLPAQIVSLPLPNFLSDASGLDPNAILNDMISTFQNLTNRTLYPAQVERLLIDDYAYRESLVRNAIQYTGMQCLLAFASYPMIDYLGQLVGVTRLSAQGANCTLQFTLSAAQIGGFTIPAGTLVGTNDGVFAFATQSDLTFASNQTVGTVFAVATTPGPIANGYAVGNINVQINPNSLITAVANTTISAGGDNIENDDHLRARIQQAPNRFSVAGPTGAYKFWALSSDPSIIDAQIYSPVPGTVNVYVLIGPVFQPQSAPNTPAIATAALLSKVFKVINADSIRPLTDTVATLAVTEVDYTVIGTVTLFSDADPATSMGAANAAAVQLAQNNAGRIQRDIVPEEFTAAIGSAPGVYRVVLSSPTYTQLTIGQWANCASINLTQVIGIEHS